jgi:hypothetical protein
MKAICLLRMLGVVLILGFSFSATFADDELEVGIDLAPQEGTVGDQLMLTLTVVPPDGYEAAPADLPEEIGPFQVIDGSWRQGPEEGDLHWTWTGTIAAYETGDLELPEIQVVIPGDSTETTVTGSSSPLQVSIQSVLDASQESAGEPSIADLKPPASIAPDYTVVIIALAFLAALLVVALVIRFLQKRYGHRLAAAAQPVDPFNRMLPHEWAYQALQALLEGGNAVPEKSGPFFEEVARILKLYFSGRFRVELMETVTCDVPDALRQTGVEGSVLETLERILLRCDLVKFADVHPAADEFRQVVEDSYALVDATKPASPQPTASPAQAPAESGA